VLASLLFFSWHFTVTFSFSSSNQFKKNSRYLPTQSYVISPHGLSVTLFAIFVLLLFLFSSSSLISGPDSDAALLDFLNLSIFPFQTRELLS